MVRNVKNVKKKRYFKIIAPKILNYALIGKSYVYEPSNLKGKSVKINLSTLTKSINNQSINVKFKVIDISDKKEGLTQIVGYEIMPSVVRRMVRLGKDKIDDSFVYHTKDNVKVKIKPMIITKYNTSKERRKRIIKAVRYFFYNELKNIDYDTLMQNIINRSIQNKMNDFLHYIYPLKSTEIRVIELETRRRVKELTENDFKGIEQILHNLRKNTSKSNRKVTKIENKKESEITQNKIKNDNNEHKDIDDNNKDTNNELNNNETNNNKNK